MKLIALRLQSLQFRLRGSRDNALPERGEDVANFLLDLDQPRLPDQLSLAPLALLIRGQPLGAFGETRQVLLREQVVPERVEQPALQQVALDAQAVRAAGVIAVVAARVLAVADGDVVLAADAALQHT
nr:hypothetical protein [Dongia deserti]